MKDPTEYEQLKQAAGRLLAIIHGDGGQHFEEHGLESFPMAIAVYYDKLSSQSKESDVQGD